METILVVDDDQIYLDSLKINLESYGYRVLTAGSAGEAWLKLERDPVDLVVLDARMPVEDGYSLGRRLRAHGRLAPIPMIFLTGHAGPFERLKAFDSGADDFIAKPVNAGDLAQRIRSHLKRRAWQKRIDDGLARIQDVERTRDELLELVIHELGGMVEAIEAELRQTIDSGTLKGEPGESVARAAQYARDVSQIIDGVRARHGWRRLGAMKLDRDHEKTGEVSAGR